MAQGGRDSNRPPVVRARSATGADGWTERNVATRAARAPSPAPLRTTVAVAFDPGPYQASTL